MATEKSHLSQEYRNIDHRRNVTRAEDIEELFALVRNADFDNEDWESFKKIWDEDTPPLPGDDAIKDRIFNNIIANSRPQTPVHMETPVRTVYTAWPWVAAIILVLFVMTKLLSQGARMYETFLYPAIIGEASTSKNAIRCFVGPLFVTLPDNSTVELKHGSVLRYNRVTYGRKNRETTLTGTAFFDVTSRPKLPFKVQCGRITTTVLGTAFNVSDTNQTVEVTVVRGKVTVGDGTAAVSTLHPHQKITISTSTMTFMIRETNMVTDLAWRKNVLVFDNIPMHEAMDRIEKRFNVTIVMTSPLLHNCRMSVGFFNNESLKEVIDQIARVRGATAMIDGNKVTIEGGNGCGSLKRF